MLDQSLEALKKYEWGVDPKALRSIEDSVVKSHGEDSARKALESNLAAALKEDIPRAAKDYVCRKLMAIGTASAVPALAALLADKELSHMARYALQRIPGDEAAAALRDAISKTEGALRVGMIASLGAREDAESVEALAGALADGDAAVSRAAALSLGAIGTPEAAAALAKNAPSAETAKSAATDATLACAENLLAAGKTAEALAAYKSLAGESQPKHVRLAAARGVVECAKKKG